MQGAQRLGSVCVGPSPPLDGTVEDVLTRLPRCQLGEPNSDLSLSDGCIGEICLGASYAQVRQAWGDPLACSGDALRSECTWDEGASLAFIGDETQEAPRLEEASFAGFLLRDEVSLVDVDGLGIGVPMSCFVEAFGEPEHFDLVRGEQGWALKSAEWSKPPLFVGDAAGAVRPGDGEGLAGFILR